MSGRSKACARIALFISVCCSSLASTAFAQLKIGTAKVDVTPEQLPVIVNGSMTSKLASEVKTRVSARAIVLQRQEKRIAMVVVDSCMMPRPFLDEVKRVASAKTGIAAGDMMISATHTHTAPSVMGALGTNADASYVPILQRRIVEAIEQANRTLSPTQVGWGSVDAPEYTALRRWVRRSDRMELDPFGNRTVRANMHAAKNLDNVVGESGPEDPQLSMICFRSPQGSVQAVLANFSMHYFGDQNISADYFGRFCDRVEQHLDSKNQALNPQAPESLVIMSHGCSGDVWRRDYAAPIEQAGNSKALEQGATTQRKAAPEHLNDIDGYTDGLVALVSGALEDAEYSEDSTLAMTQAELALKYRTPDAQRLHWATEIATDLGDRLPETREEIYAREQVFLHRMQRTKVLLQAIRIGPITVATTPTETYALTGLKLKHQSPFARTMVIELANGGDGYVPPPEQHRLGGYNTWAARSAGLEETAEPKFVGRLLSMLETVTGEPRREYRQSPGGRAKRILDAKPTAYLRLDEFSGSTARNAVTGASDGTIENGALYFLAGDDRAFTDGEPNRCLHLVDARVRWDFPQPVAKYTAFFSARNGLPLDSRDVIGWLFSNDDPWSLSDDGVHVGIFRGGKIGVQVGQRREISSSPHSSRWGWHRYCVRHSGTKVEVFIEGVIEPVVAIAMNEDPAEEHSSNLTSAKKNLNSQRKLTRGSESLYFGGRSDLENGLEGRLDEVAVFDRALSTEEIHRLLSLPPATGVKAGVSNGIAAEPDLATEPEK